MTRPRLFLLPLAFVVAFGASATSPAIATAQGFILRSGSAGPQFEMALLSLRFGPAIQPVTQSTGSQAARFDKNTMPGFSASIGARPAGAIAAAYQSGRAIPEMHLLKVGRSEEVILTNCVVTSFEVATSMSVRCESMKTGTGAAMTSQRPSGWTVKTNIGQNE